MGAKPRGLEIDGKVLEDPLKWTSKYGSVVLSAYDFSTMGGVNEAGLLVNFPYLAEARIVLPAGCRPSAPILRRILPEPTVNQVDGGHSTGKGKFSDRLEAHMGVSKGTVQIFLTRKAAIDVCPSKWQLG